MNPANRFFYAHSNMTAITDALDELGFSREDSMKEKITNTNLFLFFDRLLKEYFFVDAKNLKRISEIIRTKYNVEVSISMPSALFGYENSDLALKRKTINRKK